VAILGRWKLQFTEVKTFLQQVIGKSGDVKDMDIVYTVITRLEINKLNTELEKIDPNAFVVMSSIKDTKGGMIKRTGVQH
jgi:uncharacterized protein YebE (UPF0316 family)